MNAFALEVSTAPAMNFAELAGVLLAPYRPGYHPSGPLGNALLLSIEKRRTPAQHEIAVAIGVELALFYGCSPNSVAIKGSAPGALAVAFQATTVSALRCDPVDLLVPWRESIADSYAFQALRDQIATMLELPDGYYSRGPREAVVGALQRLALGPCPLYGRAGRILFDFVLAANIHLAITDGAGGSSSSRYSR